MRKISEETKRKIIEKYKINRSNHFAKYGWKTVFIQDEEVNNEKLILEKILLEENKKCVHD